DDETGPAELLTDGVARVVDMPVSGELVRNSIVQLDSDPNDSERIPGVAGVIYSPHPRKSLVDFHCDHQEELLRSILQGQGSDVEAVHWSDAPGGTLVVAHEEEIDPSKLAEALGIPQDEEDFEDEE